MKQKKKLWLIVAALLLMLSFLFSRISVSTDGIDGWVLLGIAIIIPEVTQMDLIKIGNFIAELRKKQKLTQEQLGEQLGVTNKTVSRWETGV